MKLLHFKKSVLVSLFFLVTCELPQDPALDPGNSFPSFYQINGKNPSEPVNATQGEIVTVDIKLMLPVHIDSIQLIIENSSHIVETIFSNNGPFSNILTDTVNFPQPGTKILIVRSYNKENITKDDTLTFSIEPSCTMSTILITSQTSKNVSAQPGAPFFIFVRTGGTDVFQYTWYHNGNAVDNNNNDTLAFTSISTNDTGAYRCLIKKVNTTDSIWSDSIKINITDSTQQNTAPVWNSEIIEVLSESGIAKACTLSHYADDTEKDELSFSGENIPQNFTLSDSVLSVSSTADTGTYLISITASDQNLSSSATVKWRVFKSEGTVSPANDTVSTWENCAVTVDALENDTVTSSTPLISGSTDGKIGRSEISNNKIIYTPDSGKTGTDTITYTVNNKKNGRIIITIQPAVITVNIDSLTINEDGSASVNVLQNDLINAGKLVITSCKNGKLGTAVIQDSSIKYTASQNVYGKDTVQYTVNGKHSGNIIITIIPVNDTLIFINPDTLLQITEGEIKTLTFYAKDVDTKSILSIMPKAWVTTTDSTDSIKITFKPGSTVVSGGTSTLKDSLIIFAKNAGDSIRHVLKIMVTDNNHSPVFSSTSPNQLSVMLNQSIQIIFAATDPDGDNVTLSLISGPTGGTFNSQSNSFTWACPRESYSPATDVTVTIRVTDGSLSKDSTFIIDILPHSWELRNSTIFTDNDSISGPLLAASGTSDLYSLSSWGMGFEINKSTDGGTSMINVFTEVVDPDSEGTTYLAPRFFELKGNKIAVAGGTLQYGFCSVIDVNTKIADYNYLYSVNAMAMSPDGFRIIAFDESYRGMPASMYYRYGSPDTTVEFEGFGPLAVGNTYSWMNGIYYLTEFSKTAPNHGFILGKQSTIEFTFMSTDANNGDTMYALNNSSLYRYNISGTTVIETPLSLPSGITPKGSAMLNGLVGWLWTTDGKVLFTNDGFKTMHQETFNDGTSNVPIHKLIISTDLKTVYAATKIVNSYYKLFRY